jgi:hypothetical protein
MFETTGGVRAYGTASLDTVPSFGTLTADEADELSDEDWAWVHDPHRAPDYDVSRRELDVQWAQVSAGLWACEQGLDEPGAATTRVEDLVGELSGWQLADGLRSMPPVAGVDGWTVIELLKGYEKLERFVQAQKVRVLAVTRSSRWPMTSSARSLGMLLLRSAWR